MPRINLPSRHCFFKSAEHFYSFSLFHCLLENMCQSGFPLTMCPSLLISDKMGALFFKSSLIVLANTTVCSVTQSCPTLCNPMTPLPMDFSGKNNGVVCHFLLQNVTHFFNIVVLTESIVNIFKCLTIFIFFKVSIHII